MRHAPSKGILSKLPPDGSLRHHQRPPNHPSLAQSIAHFWFVSWELDEPFVVKTLPHPCLHVVFESQRDTPEIFGIQSRTFSRTLQGEGWVFGIKFRPAMASLWCGQPLRPLWDTAHPAHDWFPLTDAVASTLGKRPAWPESILEVEELMCRDLPKVPRHLLELRGMLEDSVAIETQCQRLGISRRTLERWCHLHVGAPPKWVVQRYRLLEALHHALHSDMPLTQVALDHGYFDHAHFTREVQQTLGYSPSHFRQMHLGKGAK